MTLGQRIKLKRNEIKLTQKELATKLGIDHTTVSKWESDIYEPDTSTLNKLADIFNVQVDWLTGRTDDPTPPGEKAKPYYALTEKDERDIARDLERMMSDLESNEAMAFYGEPMDEETKRLIRISLENSMRLAKEMAKKKFTPKRYRGGENE